MQGFTSSSVPHFPTKLNHNTEVFQTSLYYLYITKFFLTMLYQGFNKYMVNYYSALLFIYYLFLNKEPIVSIYVSGDTKQSLISKTKKTINFPIGFLESMPPFESLNIFTTTIPPKAL